MLKRIESRVEADKRKRKSQIVIGAILIGLMVISTAGYAFLDNKDDANKPVEFNGLKFYKNGEVWSTNIQGKNFNFRYLPNELTNVSVIGSFDFSQYAGKPVYFVNNNFAYQEIIGNLGDYVLRYQEACLNNCSEFPTKTCSDNLIVFSEGNETQVWKEGNCTHISGDPLMGADAFLYRILGIN